MARRGRKKSTKKTSKKSSSNNNNNSHSRPPRPVLFLPKDGPFYPHNDTIQDCIVAAVVDPDLKPNHDLTVHNSNPIDSREIDATVHPRYWRCENPKCEETDFYWPLKRHADPIADPVRAADIPVLECSHCGTIMTRQAELFNGNAVPILTAGGTNLLPDRLRSVAGWKCCCCGREYYKRTSGCWDVTCLCGRFEYPSSLYLEHQYGLKYEPFESPHDICKNCWVLNTYAEKLGQIGSAFSTEDGGERPEEEESRSGLLYDYLHNRTVNLHAVDEWASTKYRLLKERNLDMSEAELYKDAKIMRILEATEQREDAKTAILDFKSWVHQLPCVVSEGATRARIPIQVVPQPNQVTAQSVAGPSTAASTSPSSIARPSTTAKTTASAVAGPSVTASTSAYSTASPSSASAAPTSILETDDDDDDENEDADTVIPIPSAMSIPAPPPNTSNNYAHTAAYLEVINSSSSSSPASPAPSSPPRTTLLSLPEDWTLEDTQLVLQTAQEALTALVTASPPAPAPDPTSPAKRAHTPPPADELGRAQKRQRTSLRPPTRTRKALPTSRPPLKKKQNMPPPSEVYDDDSAASELGLKGKKRWKGKEKEVL
ncbi:hypothetical protein QBC35DRAFT_474795 [Podospora australis]|uniref:Uncharacterized protein n=1 Tax=Podospora australis TaxID=1536484 RepID=A0AAN6WSG5_9PEZI|nr:hypothetical protein QBC35DRAFT_474795 [Podospora australis]